MSKWSRDQSQSMGRVAATSSGIQTRSMHLLVPLSERQKASLRRENGIKAKWSQDTVRSEVVKRTRDYLAPVKADYVPSRKKRGSSGCRMSAEKRAMVHERLRLREEFFRAL